MKRHPYGKLYESDNLPTVNIQNCTRYRKWITKIPNKKKMLWTQTILHLLCKDNRQDFKKIWGHQDFCFKGGHYYHCWVRKFQDEEFIVLTAKDHGTSIEMITTSNTKSRVNSKSKVIISFAKDMARQLKKM